LRRAGFFVEVFEQERMIGGRMATTRLGAETFDHGAQYVSARSKEFRAYLEEVAGLGYAGRWNPRAKLNGQEGAGQMLPWYVGTPGMASLVRPLAESVRIHTGRKVHTVDRKDKGWHVWFEDETSVGPFHAVAITIPAAQARLLLGRFDEISQPLSRVRMMPCWALMVRLEDKILPDQDVFSDMSEVIRWVARNNTKPGRSPHGESIVIHASPAWSRDSEDAEPEMIAEDLWGEVSHVLGLPPARPVHMTAYLWRHGLVDQSLGETFIYSRDYKVGVAGDWCLGRLAEHAFDSGNLLGKAIIESLS
jgi:renalase